MSRRSATRQPHHNKIGSSLVLTSWSGRRGHGAPGIWDQLSNSPLVENWPLWAVARGLSGWARERSSMPGPMKPTYQAVQWLTPSANGDPVLETMPSRPPL